jgi:hypothetical protein
MQDNECNVAVILKRCTLYHCKTRQLAHTNHANAFVKLGGCVTVGDSCVFRPKSTATPGGACSAGGAAVAYNANARLYWGDDHEPNTIPITAGKHCHEDFQPMLAVGNGHLLQVADTELLFNRFDEWPLTLGLLQAQSRLPTILPTSATAGTKREFKFNRNSASRRRSVPAAIGIANNADRSFQFTQSIAVSSEDGTCIKQAQLATILIGLKHPSSQQGRCSELGCARPEFKTSALETVQAAYVQQLEACAYATRSIDNEYPVPLTLFVQPPADWTRAAYQGLLTYEVASPTDSYSPTLYGDTTAVTVPTFDTPAPTPSPFIHLDNAKCTAKEHCCFQTFQESGISPLMANHAEVDEIPGDEYETTGTTMEKCQILCAKLLLCRVLTFDAGTCRMWSLPMWSPYESSSNRPVFYVNTVDHGCTPAQAVYEQGMVLSAGSELRVKQACCMHTLIN